VVDTLRLLMGPPRRLLGDVTTFVRERDGRAVTSDDAYAVLIEFQSGARAAVQMTNAAGVSDARFGIYGTDGQLTIPNIYGTELHGGKRTGKTTGPIEIPKEFQLPSEEHPLRPPFRVLLTRFVHALDHRLPSPPPNFEDALASQAMLDAARLSAREARWVDL
jgi:predicted dehydrogenase